MGAIQSLNGRDLSEPLKRECEKFTNGLIEAYIKKYLNYPPFNPKRIAEEWFNIKVEEKNEDIARSGCALTFEGKRFIIVNNESFYRRKFTIAHELAHLLFRNKIITAEDVDIERLCDYFAFNLLMPAKHFEIHAQAIESDFSFETLEKIKDRFQVSTDSMILRLNELKLIENPNRFILTLKENANKFTERDKKLRVFRRVLPKKSDFYIPENIGADTLGLSTERLVELSNLYLFSWDGIPGNDSERLIRFLGDDLCIAWAENAEILKFDDSKTIRIFKDGNSAEIAVNAKEEKATIKISDGKTHNLKAKKENGKLNIYSNSKLLPLIEENVISQMKDARTGKYKKRVVTCNATYKCYGHTEYKYIVGLFEIVRL